LRFLAFGIFLVIFGGIWTFVSLLLSLPLAPWVNKHAQKEMDGVPPNPRVLWTIWAYNLITWLPQPIIVAAATLATLERHPDAWRWLYFWVGLGASVPLGAAKEHQTLGLRDHIMLLILEILYVTCYWVPSLIPEPLWNLGSWIGR
jgi:uncharacterized membrane protein YedE/YeeE